MLLLLLCSLTMITGCAVHDGKGEPEPLWWPNGVVRSSTVASSGGEVLLSPHDPLFVPFTADLPAGRNTIQPYPPLKNAVAK